MAGKTETIEVDEATARTLRSRAARRGVSVTELVAEMAAKNERVTDGDELDELDRRWDAIQCGEPTVPHERVVQWLETWGTPAFKPWNSP